MKYNMYFIFLLVNIYIYKDFQYVFYIFTGENKKIDFQY